MRRYIISYRGEFSTVIEAETSEDAVVKAQRNAGHIEWENVGELHNDFFEDVTDEPYVPCDGYGKDCENCSREGNC